MNELPEWANAGLLITCCVVLFDSSHLLREPDSKSSLKMTCPPGGAVGTVMLAVPLTPSLVAVIVAEPDALAVTRPDEDVVATVVLLELQAIKRPVSTLLFASRSVAVSCCVWPIATV